MENSLIANNTIVNLLELVKTDRKKAEQIFNAKKYDEQLTLIRQNGYNPEIILLAEDASEIIPLLDKNEAFLALNNSNFGESIILGCLTAEQYIHILDKKSWLDVFDQKVHELPKKLDKEKGLELILGLKDIPDDETVINFLDIAGVNLIYLFLSPHITNYMASIVSLNLNPNTTEISIDIKQGEAKLFSESDVQDLLFRIEDAHYDFFVELCALIAENEQGDEKREFFRALERNPEWSNTDQENVEIFKEQADFDIEKKPDFQTD